MRWQISSWITYKDSESAYEQRIALYKNDQQQHDLLTAVRFFYAAITYSDKISQQQPTTAEQTADMSEQASITNVLYIATWADGWRLYTDIYICMSTENMTDT